jgi:hypothetical protein
VFRIAAAGAAPAAPARAACGDVDDSPVSHTTFVLVRARGVHIHDIPVISERRFFRACFGCRPVLPDTFPDADSLPDVDSDARSLELPPDSR